MKIVALVPVILSIGLAQAQDSVQEVGKPLDLDAVELELIYSNDFSGADPIEFETSLTENGERDRLPKPATMWVAEGRGGAQVCAGKLWVAPAAFGACGERADDSGQEPSHMVVWNNNRFPPDMLFEFTVNHHGSDDGLTLVFLAAEGLQGQDIFDLDLPPRDGVYRNYNRGQLQNYTVSYWSRNKKPSLVKRGEQYTNRMRKNPGANKLSTEYSRTDKCNDCDYRIRILKVGGSIAVEINGEVVNHVTDAEPLGSGYIGLRNMLGVEKVSYDDFKVWAISE